MAIPNFWNCICTILIACSLLDLIEAATPKKIVGKTCQRACIPNVSRCKQKGGQVIGHCEQNHVCCDFTNKVIGTCGEAKTGNEIQFISPSYPNFNKNDLICKFVLNLDKHTVGIKMEFLDVFMDGAGYASGSGCDSDMFFFKGFKTWMPPPMCGNFTGYSTVIERNFDMEKGRMDKLILVGLMSSDKYKWRIKFTQLKALGNETYDNHHKKGNTKIIIKTHQHQHSNAKHMKSLSHGFKNSLSQFKTQEIRAARQRQDPNPRVVAFNSASQTDSANLGVNSYSTSNDFEQGQISSGYVEGDPSNNDVNGMEQPMVVNGQDTPINQVPWQVSIRQIHVEEPKSMNEINDTMSTSTETSLDSDSTTEVASTVPPRNCSLESGTHLCGGTIISDRHILSAAHCFYTSSKLKGFEKINTLKIVMGDTDTCTLDFPEPGTDPQSNTNAHLTEQVHEIETIVFHYGYDNVAMLNDIAVIKLRHPIIFNENVKPIKMANVGQHFDGMDSLASGWGLMNMTDKTAESPYILQSSSRFIVRNSSECDHEAELFFGAPRLNVTKHPKYSSSFRSVLCTDTKMANVTSEGAVLTNEEEIKKRKVHVGSGDSGGPLVTQVDGEAVLIGIVSYGIPGSDGDAGNQADFFQSVAFYRNWIEMAMTV